MSKNSQDEPDEYESIFDRSNPDSAQQTAIEVSDGEHTNSPDYIDAEGNESDPFMKNYQSDAEDADIEDGIFAPGRKEKKTGKKTAPLMWAVSLLAFVGVGAFVYVSNPDIVSKVTHNIGGGDEVTLPNQMAPLDTAEATSEEHPDQTVETPAPSVQASDSPTIQPDEITQDVPHDPSTDSSQTTIENPSVVAAPAADLLTPEQVQNTQPVVTTAPASVEQPAPAIVTPSPNPAMDSVPSAVTSAEEPVVTPTVEVNETSTPVPADAATTIAAIENVPSAEVITPTNDKEEGEEGGNEVVGQSQATPSTVTVPTPDAVPSVPNVQPTLTKNNVSSKVKETTPVVVASKEEKKAIDNANLDKYFDSPNGKMLKDIPAPSMNPSKGSHESIIVVNKKGQKTKSDHSKPAGKVTIETTNLNAQMVSANRAMKLGRYDAAKEMYDELYRLNPRDGQILSGRAILLQKMGFADQAISAYEELLKLYPDNTDAIVNLSGLIRKQYPAVALSKLLDLHMAHPNNVAVTAQLGVAYADAGNYSDALRYLGDAAAMEPKNALHFYNMAVISEKAKKPEQAISYYEKALEVDAIYGDGYKTISKEKIYDRLAQIRGN